MNPDDIFSKQLKQMEKEKREKDNRLKAQEKKVNNLIENIVLCSVSTVLACNVSFNLQQVDYFERAKRVEEIPKLNNQYEEQRKADKVFHYEQEEERVSFK